MRLSAERPRSPPAQRKRRTWKAYIQGVDQGPAGQPKSCRHPSAGADPNQTPQTTDPYVTWRNPFVYFASLTSGTECAQNDVGLGQLSTDLKTASTTPNFSYIAPDPCNDGSDQPCTAGAPAGLAQADTFLKSVVPQIEASPAYKQDGLIVITFDQAPQSGLNVDTNSCCNQPSFPNSPARGRRRQHDDDTGDHTGGHDTDHTSATSTTSRPDHDDGADDGASTDDDGLHDGHRVGGHHAGSGGHDPGDHHADGSHRPRDPARRRPRRPAADLAVRAAGVDRHDRRVQPLLAAAQHRGSVRPPAPRLRRRPGPAGVRQRRVERQSALTRQRRPTAHEHPWIWSIARYRHRNDEVHTGPPAGRTRAGSWPRSEDSSTRAR